MTPHAQSTRAWTSSVGSDRSIASSSSVMPGGSPTRGIGASRLSVDRPVRTAGRVADPLVVAHRPLAVYDADDTSHSGERGPTCREETPQLT